MAVPVVACAGAAADRAGAVRRVPRILVFRIGSLGDTCVAVPALRAVRTAWPDARVAVLTNFSVDGGRKAAPLASVIGASGLVDEYLEYRGGALREAARLLRRIRAWAPDRVVYLMPVRSPAQLLRDRLFFALAGVWRLSGWSWRERGQRRLADGAFEPEAARLARALAPFQTVRLDDPAAWDLGLTGAEQASAAAALGDWPGRAAFLVASVGTKVDVKDWGEDRWLEWARVLGTQHPGLGLALIGVAEEQERSARLAQAWPGPVLNLCGRLQPRESAALIARARAFVGHDSGPMHLAAAVGVPCVAVFSARNLPRVWFPAGARHQVLYHRTDCAGCNRDVCIDRAKECIRSITIAEVVAACDSVLAGGAA